MNIEEYNKIRKEKTKTIQTKDCAYVDLYYDDSCLGGWFTADELRKIADDMDELKEYWNSIIDF